MVETEAKLREDLDNEKFQEAKGKLGPVDELFDTSYMNKERKQYRINKIAGGAMTNADFEYLDLGMERAGKIARYRYYYKTPEPGFDYQMCIHYADDILEDEITRKYFAAAGFTMRKGDVYTGHSGVYLFPTPAPGEIPEKGWLFHVGSGFAPKIHTDWTRYWPVQISFEGDTLNYTHTVNPVWEACQHRSEFVKDPRNARNK
jgi:hypothetical protein